jgi:hypothetical protein
MSWIVTPNTNPVTRIASRDYPGRRRAHRDLLRIASLAPGDDPRALDGNDDRALYNNEEERNGGVGTTLLFSLPAAIQSRQNRPAINASIPHTEG